MDLDPERSAFTVIERTLAWGDVPELRWLFAQYGSERLAEWVRQSGWYCLPRRRFKYWLSFFELTDYRHGERMWPHRSRRAGTRSHRKPETYWPSWANCPCCAPSTWLAGRGLPCDWDIASRWT
jgi:hypothetical protein